MLNRLVRLSDLCDVLLRPQKLISVSPNMVRNQVIVCNGLLVASCAYTFISGNVGTDKVCGIISTLIYGVAGVVAIVDECFSDSKLRDIDTYMHAIKLYSALDLLTAEVLVSVAQVDMKYALCTLIPSALDLGFYFANRNWNYVTTWWHIADIVAFVVIAFKDTKYILVPAAIAFIISCFGNYDTYTELWEAIGLFCAASAIGGKDLKDYGVPIG